MIGEVIAFGDELICGKSLDTNSQWLSQQLSDRGVQVRFHATVGDSLDDSVAALRIAASRADLVVTTGGLGPTEDDLTRAALAELAGVALEFVPESWEHIQSIFRVRGRSVPEKNRVQAFLPAGASTIPNPHGTAPGIEMSVTNSGRTTSFISLPGVPREMQEMWETTVAEKISQLTGEKVMLHHTLHCLGAGESEIEQLIPAELMRRGRDPLVGITASSATISLRVSTFGANVERGQHQLQSTVDELRTVLAEFVYGEQGQSIADVVALQLKASGQRLGIIDLGLGGEPHQMMSESEESRDRLIVGLAAGDPQIACRICGIDGQNIANESALLERLAKALMEQAGVQVVVAIGRAPDPQSPTSQLNVVVAGADRIHHHQLSGGGHPSVRQTRMSKLTLNLVRKHLQPA